MKYIVALDLGTTTCRALRFDTLGRVAAQASRAYPLHTLQPGCAEQDPAVLLAAADAVVPEVLQGVDPADVLCLSLCTYMHSLVVLGAGGEYLTPVLTWADTRAAAQVEAMRARPDWHALYSRTGCPPHTMYPLYKLLWCQAQAPELLRPPRRFASIKDLLLAHWTGHWALDYNLATGTGLLDEHTLDWDPWALDLLGISREQLPAVVPTTRTFPLTHAGLGLRPGTPVVAGAGDGVLSSLGAGAIEPGSFAAMVGTSAALRACVPAPVADPQARVFCYYLDAGRWILGGSLNNGGVVLQWLRDLLFPGAADYAPVLDAAARAPAGSGGLLFLPYLAGERSPGFNARARGVWFGLGLEHERAHLARSGLEAVAYRLYSVLGPLQELTGCQPEIRATGGFVRSRFWLQICADVLGLPISVPNVVEGSALGACVVGAVAVCVAADLSYVHRLLQMAEQLKPDPANHARYAELWAIYQRIYSNLQGEFAALAALREGDR